MRTAHVMTRLRDALTATLASMATAALLAQPAMAATPAVSAGYRHVLALSADGTVRAWGDDSQGQLGQGRTLETNAPALVPGISGVAKVAAGAYHVVALMNDGTVRAWGRNSLGALGDGTTTSRPTSAPVTGLADIVDIAAGENHTLALRRDGTVWSWGVNWRGQLGYDEYTLVPRQVPGLPAIERVAAGVGHSLALARDGTLWAWGGGDYGQLGDGTLTEAYGGRAKPGLARITEVAAISAGSDFSVAVRRDGTIWTWGRGDEGSLGLGVPGHRNLPERVVGVTDATAVSSGIDHTLALRRDGTIMAWGGGYPGQLGDGRFSPSPVPVRVAGLVGVTAIASGYFFSMARTNEGAVWTWGYNSNGQLGDGTTENRGAPVRLVNLTATAIAAGGFHAFTVAGDGSMRAWGENSFGELGTGGGVLRSTPAVVPGATDIQAIAAGGTHSLALRRDGVVLAWGANALGQLGDETYRARSTPAAVPGLAGVRAIAAGYYHAMALKEDGTVWMWGYGYDGQLGLGTAESVGKPTAVPGLSGIVAIASGPAHALALGRDGTLWAWGANEGGQLGDGSTARRTAPVRVSGSTGLAGVKSVAAGTNHTLALTEDGRVWSWGLNYAGELGDGTTTARSLPGRVEGLAGISGVAAGNTFSHVLRSDGTVLAFGANWNGQLGDGSGDDQLRPVPLQGLAGVAQVTDGGTIALALKADGSAWAWGSNVEGQLGDGTFIDRATPVVVLREDGKGGVATNDWFLDLDPSVPTTIASDKVPVFLLVAAATNGRYTADLRFRPEDVGTNASVYVFALAPSTAVKAARDGSAPLVLGKATSRPGAKADAPDCVLAQLDASGNLIAVTAAQLQAAQSGVLSAQGASVNVLNAASSPATSGATFFVGYGSSSGAMIADGVYRDVVSVPGAAHCTALASYTGLWWNSAENGWGINFTHQGSTLFGTLFTYDADRAPLWLVMSGGTRQADGVSFAGDLYRTTGPAFNANPFTPITAANYSRVGTMSAAFTGVNSGTLSYTVNGQAVTKTVSRLVYGSRAASCVPVTGSRAAATNYQDLWWNAAEGGWGVNVTHQDNTLFATLFTYDAAGRDLWLVMSGGARQADGTYQGTLYRASGPPFNASPFTPITAANLASVGTMRFAFADGERGTLTYSVNGAQVTKAITRLVFASPPSVCN